MEEIRVHVTGHSAPKGAPFAVHVLVLGSRRPSQTSTDGLLPNPLAYYDVSIDGISDGTATLRVTNDSGQPTRMQHWEGARWADFKDMSHTAHTVSGEVPVKHLHGTPPKKTPIVIGT